MSTGGGGTGDSHQDVLLYRFYRQVARRPAAWLGTGYDVAAGAHRSSGWLGGRTPSPHEILAGPRGKHVSTPELRADRDADRAVAALYDQHYAALVRLASLLTGDAGTAEEIVQDSFVALHAAWGRRPPPERALECLRQSVVIRSRSLRRRRGAGDGGTAWLPGGPGVAREAAIQPGRSALVVALRSLPARQREALVLRYYADLSEEETARILGVAVGTVKSQTHRAL
jgi:RNA polymerase sigma-70 factor (sigma-E family)